MSTRVLALVLLVFCMSADVSSNLSQQLIKVAKAHPEATLGFYAIEIESGAVIGTYNEAKNMAPASTLKTLTTAAALEILGPDYRFQTRFGYSAPIEEGILKGNLHVTPSGDPTLGSKYFNGGTAPDNIYGSLVSFLKERGIKGIQGKLVLELHGFETERVPPSWSFDDLGNYYGASVGPMNCFDNTVFLNFSSGNAGSITKLESTSPQIPGLTFSNEVEAAKIGYDNAYVYGAPRQYNRTLRGQIPQNRTSFKIKASMPEPEMFAMLQLVKELRNAGIEVPKGAVSFRKEVPASKQEHEHVIASPSLAQVVKTTNMESNNQFAEALVKAIGKKQKGLWSRKKGLEAIKEHFADKISIAQANLYDGSGLSRFNGVSPKMMAELMRYMWATKHKDLFYESLPVAGVSGSIKGMFKGSKAQNNLRAKSGYIDKVRSYSGYTKTATGKVAAFTVIVNNYETTSTVMRNDLELILRTLAD